MTAHASTPMAADAGAPPDPVSRHLQGRAWKFGGLLDVDFEICPFHLVREWQRTADGTYRYAELGRFAMTQLDPTFPDRVEHGDLLLGEENMGFGHDHDHACASLRGAGIAAVLCESSAPYFLRNSFDHGLPVIEVPGLFADTAQHDVLAVDLAAGTVQNRTTGALHRFEPLPDFLLEMVTAGGLYPYLRERHAAGEVGRG
jgi:3-isopropylmalate/(R)-2-methylmalate dehydratase small subunit